VFHRYEDPPTLPSAATTASGIASSNPTSTPGHSHTHTGAIAAGAAAGAVFLLALLALFICFFRRCRRQHPHKIVSEQIPAGQVVSRWRGPVLASPPGNANTYTPVSPVDLGFSNQGMARPHTMHEAPRYGVVPPPAFPTQAVFAGDGPTGTLLDGGAGRVGRRGKDPQQRMGAVARELERVRGTRAMTEDIAPAPPAYEAGHGV
jgi:hypothetical protein